MLQPKAFGNTHVGLKRKDNQDSFLIDKDINLYAVADGMGGHKNGAVASKTAIETLHLSVKETLSQKNFSPEIALKEAFEKANHEVYSKNQSDIGNLEDMGTTLVAALIWEKEIFFANVGDSRAYLFRQPNLWRITEDHSILNDRIKKGLIDEANMDLIVDSNVITRSIGFIPNVQVDTFQREIQKKDLFMLCSDGLTSMIKDKDIAETIENYSEDVLVDRLIDKSLDAGGNDNVSVVVISP